MERIASDLLKPIIIDIILEIKHGVYAANGKDETFDVCFGRLCFRVTTFVFLFLCDVFKEKNTKSAKSNRHFFCRLPLTSKFSYLGPRGCLLKEFQR